MLEVRNGRLTSYLLLLTSRLAGMTRLGLATSYVTGRRSNQLSYTPTPNPGGQNRTRTCDIFRVKEALFQLSYPPR